MFVTTFNGFFKVDCTTAACTSIKSGTYPNSLSFVPKGTVDPNAEALVASSKLSVVPGLLRYFAGPDHRDLVRSAPMGRGEVICSLCATEPDVGSDIKAMRTAAKRVDGGYEISGSKAFITNGSLADFYIVAAVVEPACGREGIGLFVVERERLKPDAIQKMDKTSVCSSDTTWVSFDAVRVGDDALLAEISTKLPQADVDVRRRTGDPRLPGGRSGSRCLRRIAALRRRARAVRPADSPLPGHQQDQLSQELQHRKPIAGQLSLSAHGGQVVGAVADDADLPALRVALRDVDTLVLVSSDGPVAEVVVHYHNLIAAAADCGVTHVVALSGTDADQRSPFCYAVGNGYTEQMLRDSGCGFSIARASIYTEFLLAFVTTARAGGQLRLPAGDGQIPPVCRGDVGRCLAVLAIGPPTGRHHDITGP